MIEEMVVERESTITNPNYETIPFLIPFKQKMSLVFMDSIKLKAFENAKIIQQKKMDDHVV